MTTAILIPFRGPSGAKTRLADVLDEPDRASLALAMLRHVVRAAVASHVGTVTVVSPSEEARRECEALGVPCLMEAPGSLNSGLSQARDRMLCEGATAVVIVAADLPGVTPADLAALVAAGEGGAAIAPDRAGTGTNALALTGTAVRLAFQFGEGSSAAHRQALAQLGVRAETVSRPGLAADLDEPADLALLAGSTIVLDKQVARAIADALASQAGKEKGRHG